MNWTVAVDGYCERLGPGLGAEPVNAVTNLAFLIAAAVAWRASAGVPIGRVLAAILFAIGLGSLLFHTIVTRWAALADVIPIAIFILVYVWAVNRLVLGKPVLTAAATTAAYLPFHAGTAWALSGLPVIGVSAGYLPVPIAILLYAALLWRSEPTTARAMAAGAGILAVSILLRSLDMGVCGVFPLGTHFVWHLLNAVMLWWMIRVVVRHERGLRGWRHS